MSEVRIKSFVKKLSAVPSAEDFFNPYHKESVGYKTCRKNLKLYLFEVLEKDPDMFLVGEAPGYQGSRQSGVPFSSEFLVLEGVESLGMLGSQKGYAKKDLSDKKVWKEPTATIMWKTLAELDHVPLLWSIFPFHPHKPGDSFTNRAPRSEEINMGKEFVLELSQIFGIKTIVAVGNVSHKTLLSIGIDCPKVRHPSHGGATKFREQLKDLLENNR